MSKADETRRRILGSARRLLETGDGPVSMGAIAREAGVTRQLLYVHFSGRAELLLELSREVDREVRTAARQVRVDDAPSALEALRETVALQGHIKPRIHGVATAVDRLRATDPDAAAAWEEREEARYGRCLEVANRLRHEGRLAPAWQPATAARIIWSATSQRAWAELVEDAGWSTRAWVRHTTGLLERALLRANIPD